MRPDICIYHAPCIDGLGAAYAVWKKFGVTVEYIPAKYGDNPPDVTGKRVVICDFSYPREVLEEMAAKAKQVTILDHHKTAKEDLKPLLYNGTVCGQFDMERSGAVMAWEWFHSNPVPELLLHIQDRDLWKFELVGSREVHLALATFAQSDFAAIDGLIDKVEYLNTAGHAMRAKEANDVTQLIQYAQREMVIGGLHFPVVNAPYFLASEIGNKLSQHSQGGYGATYFDAPEGRKFSLRSIGDFDVSAIAKLYGGGGHKNAAGFTVPLGWEGDV